MALEPGQQLGSYQIVSPLGSGGMGDVYRARDMKLGREVALKVLPHIFSRDEARMARFAREAQLLASLEHVSYCTPVNEVCLKEIRLSFDDSDSQAFASSAT